MARTKQTARKKVGGKAPRQRLVRKASSEDPPVNAGALPTIRNTHLDPALSNSELPMEIFYVDPEVPVTPEECVCDLFLQPVLSIFLFLERRIRLQKYEYAFGL